MVQRVKAILLLLIMGMLMAPWMIICTTHPLGHEHHHHGKGPSPCELRARFKGTAYWPPMDCHKVHIKTDDYPFPEKLAIKAPVATVAMLAVLCEWIPAVALPQTFAAAPDPKCNAGPPSLAHTLRGPPCM